MRIVLPISLALSALALAGCVAQPVQPASLDAPLGMLRVPSSSEVVTITGHVALPSNGMVVLPGQSDEQPLEVPAEALLVRLNLSWAAKGPTPETSDLDLYVFDADGEQVGQAASLADPEAAQVRVTSKVSPGIWTLRVVNFNNPETDYTILAEVVR